MLSQQQSILIVDDKPNNLFALEQTLAQLDVSVVKALSGNEALAATLNQEFSLAILDVQMPEMDGFELAELLGGEERTQTLPIIFLTAAYDAEEKVYQGYRAGAVDYIVKPYNQEVLLAKARVFLTLDRQRQELAMHRQHLEERVESRSRELRQALAELKGERDEARRRAGELDSLLGSMRAVLKSDRFADAARAILAGLSAQVGCQMGIVALLNEDGTISVVAGVNSQEVLVMPLHGVLEEACRNQSVVIVNDFQDGLPAGHVRLEQVLIVPVTIDDVTVGLIGLANKAGGFGDNDARLARLFAEVAAIAIRDARVSGALKNSEDRFRRFFEEAPEYCAIVSPTGMVTAVNRVVTEKLGYSVDEIVGQPIWVIYPPESGPQPAEEFANWSRTGSVHNQEMTIMARSGERRAVLLSVSAVRDESESLLHWIFVQRDITERCRADQERRLLQEQLSSSQRLEAVGRLAGGVAHDFNNLLSVILASCSFVLDDLPADSPQRADVEEIRQAGERAAKLTRQLLSFSSRQVLNPQVVDLNAIVTDLNKMLHRLIGEDVTIHLKLEPEIQAVLADPGHIEQVIVNLVVNARDAMPGGGEIIIETSNTEVDPSLAVQLGGSARGPHVLLAISDTGWGMDEATRAQISEPFFTTKEKGKGTGLGLSTVYGIVHQSGGFVQVESAPGRGATFSIYLPRCDTEPDPGSQVPLSALSVAGGETILVVEDEPQLLQLVVRALRNAHYTVLEASGLEEARRVAAEEKSIDLLLTDVVMPGGGGHEVSAALRALHPALVVIYMSGYTDEKISQQGILGPGVLFLPKPFTPRQLLAKIGEVLNQAARPLDGEAS